MRLVLAPLVLLSAANAQTVEPAAAPKWRALFDGATLDGWTRLGGKSDYAIEDGAIVGTARPGQPNTFLCTDRSYGDFELELEFEVDPTLNSGVQIRSHSRPDYRRGRVHGYQVEIDPSKRAWTGGLYDESRRGWLNDLQDDPKAQAAFRQGEWNRFRIVCDGAHFRTWVNDVPAADMFDTADLEGFIGLQVHGVGQNDSGPQVRWRNIRILDRGRHEWTPLFDGATLGGWRALPGGAWRVEDGLLIGTSEASETRHGILLSEQRLEDFTVRIVYRAVRGNSGLYFRSQPVEGGVGVHGFQAEIDQGEYAGGLYETGGRAWVVRPDPKKIAGLFKKDDFNEMTVSAFGRRVVVHVNGVETAELRDDPGRLEGHLGLQLHGGQDMRIEVRSIELLRPRK